MERSTIIIGMEVDLEIEKIVKTDNLAYIALFESRKTFFLLSH